MDNELNFDLLAQAFKAETEEIRRALATKPRCSVCGEPLGTCCYAWRWDPGADYVPVGDDRQLLMDIEQES
jgi:hypothetical protein